VFAVFLFLPPQPTAAQEKTVYSQRALFVSRNAGTWWYCEQQFISKKGACIPSRTLSVLPNAGNGLATPEQKFQGRATVSAVIRCRDDQLGCLECVERGVPRFAAAAAITI
jgi:hypothetical protein